MALIFPRLARNFIKAGYFPTDERTLCGVIEALDIDGADLRILDPCCGEGCALAAIKDSLTAAGASVQALGVEFDRERAWHAKRLLDVAIHSDINDVTIGARSVGLLFLNPPYGDVVADRAQTGDAAKRERLEKIFVRRCFQSLRYGGVLVLIVPFYVLDEGFASLIARNFERVRFFMAPDQSFKQCVIFGVRRRSDRPDPEVAAMLERAGRGELSAQVLPEQDWPFEPYRVPGCEDAELRFQAHRIDAEQLAAELERLEANTLWPQFAAHFGQLGRAHRPPLRQMSPWHLALALAAGQICGRVVGRSGEVWLIKGDTFKGKTRSVETQEAADGSISETVILTDIFVPVIRGIDFTPGPNLGAVVTIQ